jgi:polar amino acid transport system substrate-binding protein
MTLLVWIGLLMAGDLTAAAPATAPAGAAATADRIRLTNGEWAPYLSERLPHFGAASHIVAEAYKAAGIDVQYGFFPWKRSYKLAREGHWHGTLVWVYTAERAEDFLYSDVVIRDPEYLFHLKSRSLNWQTPADLAGLTIGATLHTVYPTLELAAAAGILRLERAGNYDSLYQRLLKRRIDAIPQVSQVGRYYQQQTLSAEERDRITHAPTIVQERQYHLILSKKAAGSGALIARFNEGLRAIKADGTYARIIKALETGAYDE